MAFNKTMRKLGIYGCSSTHPRLHPHEHALHTVTGLKINIPMVKRGTGELLRAEDCDGENPQVIGYPYCHSTDDHVHGSL